jgi:hypothetical protein
VDRLQTRLMALDSSLKPAARKTEPATATTAE